MFSGSIPGWTSPVLASFISSNSTKTGVIPCNSYFTQNCELVSSCFTNLASWGRPTTSSNHIPSFVSSHDLLGASHVTDASPLATRPGGYRGAAEDATAGGAALYGSSAGLQGDVQSWSREMSPGSISMRKKSWKKWEIINGYCI